MIRNGFVALLIAGLIVCGDVARADKKKKSHQEKKIERLNDLSRRLNRHASSPHLTQEGRFLLARISTLMDRARESPAGSYVLSRLLAAIDDFLDAVDEIDESFENKRDSGDNAQEKAARDLQRAYFRVKQGDYFVRQSAEDNAQDYLKTARALYQQARNAYEAGDYRKTKKLAEAAREVIDGLESLAQAAVRIPEPPRL